MHRLRKSAWNGRPTAAALVLAAHGFFLFLLWIEGRLPMRLPPATREIVSIPITLEPLPEVVVEPDPRDESRTEPQAQRPRAAPGPESPPVDTAPRPSTAITLPAPDAPAQPRLPAPDWYRESSEQAALYAERTEKPPATIGRPVQKMREPCKPKASSFRFERDKPPSNGIGFLTPGWEEPEPDSHLFDDMMAGRRSKSSVPDPNVCD